MRLGISLLNYRPGRIGGTETYLLQLLPAIAKVREQGEELFVIVHRDAADRIVAPGLRQVVVERGDAATVAARIAEAYSPWRDRPLERLFDSLQLDVAFFPQQSIYPKRAPVPAVLGACDVQHLFYPEYFGAFDRTFRGAIYPYSLRRAARIIAISEYTKKTLVERAGADARKLAVVPHGSARVPAAVPPFPALQDTNYLYYPAVTAPHKNHATLFRTYAALRGRGEIDDKLVLTGARTKLWRELRGLIERLGLAGEIVHLGLLPFDDVMRVYSGARAVVFPTQFEGFGLPVLEAVSLGKKVITSRLEIFGEIGVPAEWQIDFARPEELLSALRRPGPTVLQREPISWDEAARRTLVELRRAARVDA